MSYHIVGLNSLIKNNLIRIINSNKDYYLVDLDKLSYQIRTSYENIKLLRKLKRASDKKLVQKELNDYWKISMQKEVDKVIENKKDKLLIFIGLISKYDDHKIKIKLNAKNKFLLDVKPEISASQTIEYNLGNYANYIIKGKFPLQFIDKNYLVKERNKINQAYLKMEYIKKRLDTILNKFKKNSNTKIFSFGNKKKHNKLFGNQNDWYLGSSKDYGIKFKIIQNKELDSMTSFAQIINQRKLTNRNKKNKKFVDMALDIYAYKDPWLALLSSIENINDYVIKGFLTKKDSKKIPFIEEKHKDSFKELNRSGFINKISDIDFSLEKSNLKHKRKVNNDVQIKEKFFIPSIENYLIDHGVKFIYYED